MTEMTVAELVGRLLAVEASAAAVEEHRKALRAELEARARDEHEASGALPRWSVPNAGTASWCERKGALIEVAPSEFLAWATEHRPEAVERRVAGWLTNELARTTVATPDGQVVTPDGELVAGLTVTAPSHYLSVRLDREAKARAVATLAGATGETAVAPCSAGEPEGAWARGETPDLDLTGPPPPLVAPEERW